MIIYGVWMSTTLSAYAENIRKDNYIKDVVTESLIYEAESLSSLIMTYAFQVLVFAAFRIAYFLFITIFLCSCQCNSSEFEGMRPETEEEMIDEDFDELKDQIFSY